MIPSLSSLPALWDRKVLLRYAIIPLACVLLTAWILRRFGVADLTGESFACALTPPPKTSACFHKGMLDPEISDDQVY